MRHGRRLRAVPASGRVPGCLGSSIRPLLPRLSFTEGRASSGYAFRRGAFAITPEDYRVIACALGVTDHVDQVESDPALPGDAKSTSRDTSSAKDLPLAIRRPSASTKPS